MCVLFLCSFVPTCAATPAPIDKLEKNGKEVEKEEDKEESEAPSDKVKERDEGKEVDSKKTGDAEEVGRCHWHLTVKTSSFSALNQPIFASFLYMYIYVSVFANLKAVCILLSP